ncbi:MAG TPA: hotdog fold thioesterase [Steroidobacteraceae bacterium]|nr:hotdog fold thioesterase [Steroidobacteraceae bacterium]
MSIWFQQFSTEEIKALQSGTMDAHLGVEIVSIGPDHLSARMPVNERTVQPHGILHGGASAALAETLGSIGGSMVVDPERYRVIGQEINANHIRSVREGHVHGTARPIHLGRRSQVWAIEIVDDQKRLVCVSRLTLAVIERRPG